MASKVTRVGSLDIQFQQNWDQTKGNQLVQSVQQTIQAVNQAMAAIAALQSGTGGGVTAPITLATLKGLGPEMAVSGLTPGQVLVATAANNAAFEVLTFGDLALTDPESFVNPPDGSVIMFHTGFWTAMPDPSTGLGLADPGANALAMWNESAHGFAWAIPAVGGGIKLVAGAISVDATQLDHSKFEGLQFTLANPTTVANDHPQYAMRAAVNIWALLQTFSNGLISNSDIDLFGNLEQVGQEPEWRVQNTDDVTDEGTWRVHVEPGQLIISSVSDDGSDGENWLCVTRIAEIVDAVNISSNSFTWNGAQVLTADSVLPSGAGGALASNKATLSTSANAALTADAALTVNLNTPGWYDVEAFLAFFEATSGAGGFQFDFNAGSAAIANPVLAVHGFSTAAFSNAAITSISTATAIATVGTGSASPSWVRVKGTIQVTAAGTFGIRWAQASILAIDPTTLTAGSHLVLTKIG